MLDNLPREVREHPLLDERNWLDLRGSGREPLDSSPMVTTLRDRAEFLIGAWLIDRVVPPHLGGSLLANLQPQMLRTADVLAAGRFQNGVLEPRRSAKTTALWCVLLGRCYLRPQYQAGYTMLTTAKKATERYRLDVYTPIVLKWGDPKTRPVKIINSNGFERVEFGNGSVLAILSPDGDAVRSGAYDTLVLDEGGEALPEKWADIVAAVLPSFDTRGDRAQVVIAGTGGRYRDGSHFWDVLHDEEAGRLRYGVPDDIDEQLMHTWEGGAADLIEQIHPGLDGLTTLPKIRANFFGLIKLGWQKFAAEYLGYFGREGAIATAIAHGTWFRTLQPGKVPEGVTPAALAFAIHPGGLWSAIGVTWILDDEPDDLVGAAWALDGHDTTPRRVGFKLIHHQAGNGGMVQALYRAWKQTKLPITYDDSPQEAAVIQELLARARPKPKVAKQRFADKGVAHTRLLNDLEAGRAVHWEQAPLDGAAAVAVPRKAGKSRLLGIPDNDPTADITGVETFALALQATPMGEPRAALRATIVN